MIRNSVAMAALGFAAACGGPQAGALYSQFWSEAGAIVDTGEFGNATMNNAMAMRNPQSYAYDLGRRFAQDVPSTVNFAFNSAVLDAGAMAALREQARWIRQFPEVRFRVYGHTDLVGSNAYNKRLGMARARAVVGYLASQGISTARLEAVVSFGETQPLIVTAGQDRRNRRTVTEVSGFVQDNPTVLDGRYAEVVYREYIRSAQPATTLGGVSGDSE